eukprot:403354976
MEANLSNTQTQSAFQNLNPSSASYKQKYHNNNNSPSPFRSQKNKGSLLTAHQNNVSRLTGMQPSQNMIQQNQVPSVYQALHQKRQNGGGFTSQGHRQVSRKFSKNSILGNSQLLSQTMLGKGSGLPYSVSPDKRYQNKSNIFTNENKSNSKTNANWDQQEEQKQYSTNNLNIYANLENCKKEGANQQNSNEKKKEIKDVIYSKPGVKIGMGKFHQIDLIIYQNELHALKKIPKSSIDKGKRIEHLKNEKNINNFLKDRFKTSQVKWFVSLEETFVDQDSVNFIFEYLPGSDLFWVIQNEMNLFLGKQKTSGGQRDWVKFYAAEILVALELLHSLNIIYRDLKPENVMIDKDGHIKLIDFGFAKKLSSQSKNRTLTNCGTLGYSAPEVLMGTNQGYSFQVDIWSFGILLCELIQGSLPFDNKDDPQMIEQQIVKGEYRMPRDADQTARDLISQILVLEPNLRLSIQDIKQHKYFADINWDQVIEKKLEPAPYKPNPLKYRYLLQNKYPKISSIQGILPQDGENLLAQLPQNKVDSPKKSVLGDFTMHKINKEFENF